MSENSSHNVHNDCLWYLLSIVPIVTSLYVSVSSGEKSVIEHVINARARLSEMRDIVGQILIDKQSKMKAWYDRNTGKRHFSPGDEVLVLLPTESSKMTATWKGPFRIVRKLSDVNYQVIMIVSGIY
jgi:hypothetical protein